MSIEHGHTSKLSIRRNDDLLLKPWTVYSGTGCAQNTLGRFHTWRGARDYVLRRLALQKAAGREDYWVSTQARDTGWRKLGEYRDAGSKEQKNDKKIS